MSRVPSGPAQSGAAQSGPAPSDAPSDAPATVPGSGDVPGPATAGPRDVARFRGDGDSDADRARMFDAEFWDERYGGRDAVWSGRPNQRLVEEVAGLAPGTAVDVGCGEGADALWLAERGWQVQAVDFSAAGLARAEAAAAGRDGAERVRWVRGDATTWTPGERVDLVTAQFFHLPSVRFRPLFQHLAAMVAPGGSLLVVGHHPSDRAVVPRPHSIDLFYTAEELVASLDPTCWEVVAAEARPRPAVAPDGSAVTVHDAVFHGRRR